MLHYKVASYSAHKEKHSGQLFPFLSYITQKKRFLLGSKLELERVWEGGLGRCIPVGLTNWRGTPRPFQVCLYIL